MLFEIFSRSYRKIILEQNKEILQLKEENKRLDELLEYRNSEYKALEFLFLKESEYSTKLVKLNNRNLKLKSDILKLFQFLGFKENSYLIPIAQMNNKDLINDIFQNLKEENEE